MFAWFSSGPQSPPVNPWVLPTNRGPALCVGTRGAELISNFFLSAGFFGIAASWSWSNGAFSWLTFYVFMVKHKCANGFPTLPLPGHGLTWSGSPNLLILEPFQLFPIFFWQLPFALLEHSGNLAQPSCKRLETLWIDIDCRTSIHPLQGNTLHCGKNDNINSNCGHVASNFH